MAPPPLDAGKLLVMSRRSLLPPGSPLNPVQAANLPTRSLAPSYGGLSDTGGGRGHPLLPAPPSPCLLGFDIPRGQAISVISQSKVTKAQFCTCTHTQTHSQTHIHSCTDMHTHARKHALKHAHMYTHSHIHIRTDAFTLNMCDTRSAVHTNVCA